MKKIQIPQPKSKIFSPSIRVIRSKLLKRVKGYRLEYPFLNNPRKSFHLGMFQTMDEAEAARDNMYRTLLQAQKHEHFGS